MMARCRTLWTGIFALLTAGVSGFTHLSFNLCKWCEASSPVCKDSVCFSNCSLTSFCSSTDEICIAIWRKTNGSMSVQTMCHDPSLPLEGLPPRLLLNFTSRDCTMLPAGGVEAEGGAQAEGGGQAAMMLCGCTGEHECNDKLLFNKGANGFSRLQSKDVLPVVVVSLVPPVLVALVAAAAFYFYRTHRPDKPRPPPARPAWPAKRTPDLYQAFGEGGVEAEDGS
ncbi:hypothetical protein OYC64_018484 [Pagothenia borchgrevinki]|uniref:Transforming growth factor beta receptor 2 ectodomain domain-containing protein n=1 Tax=Pagothenia borchgrevinki TaxID=8213 RepID=A0ABD2GP67_PAGBO